ncbi:11332_t:CDS:10 [Funneliformis mosseae]|uniref:11332_t:CDS:1 n=1 Tax=Funneliformis mosseae TaxID=27381 RepID=A0A9N9HTP2_FUNMO|nr:11332_t:CDS:10 [Funneliformis mosseae]
MLLEDCAKDCVYFDSALVKETNEEVVSQSVKTDNDSDCNRDSYICLNYELLVPAKLYTLGQSEWTKDLKKNNRKQELIFERDILMTEQHNEAIRTALPHVQILTRKRRNSNDGLTRNANDQEEGRFLQEEQDELGNQSGDEKKRKDCEVEEECSSILFDEKNEDSLIESIDKSKLINKTRLLISKPSENISEYKLSSGGDLLTMFKKYQKSIPKCRRVTTPAYWGILDLTRESLTLDYLQEYFNKNCEESHQIKDIKKFHTNIQFIKENMYSFNDSMTEEELKMIFTFPIFRSILQLNIVKDAWGEIQSMFRMKSQHEENAKKYPNKFEALFGEVSDSMTSLGISSSFRKKQYLDKKKFGSLWMDPSGYVNIHINLIYSSRLSGLLIDTVHSTQEDDCGLFEDIYCILKELNSVKELYQSNMLRKRRRTTMENSLTLNMNRTPD